MNENEFLLQDRLGVIRDTINKYGTIYIIKNNVNEKVYIGQTTIPVIERFKQHCKNSVLRSRRYKLYNAMNKYGKNNFYVETLETNIPLSKLDEKEIEYISKYNSYFNGYNSTKGGDGRTINKVYDEEKIIDMYLKENKSSSEIAQLYDVNYATIIRVLHKNNIKVRHDGNKYEQFNKETFITMWNNKKLKIDDIAKYFDVIEKTMRR
ncbi:MAG: GIY-YIG nuclease family protein [Bacteroidales bacterium]|nr:GIY-YIG nuclease family protein [Candidatus Scybalousia scybalohippi]